MRAAIHVIRCCLILLCSSISVLPASAADDGHQDSLVWEARSRIIRSALVLEAEVMRTGLTTVRTDTGCEWVAEIWLRPATVIWGDCADQNIRAFSAALPIEYRQMDTLAAFADSVRDQGCLFYQLDDQALPLPAPGAVGLFQLQEKGPIQGELNLGVVRHAFQPLGADSLISIPAGPGREPHSWRYDEFKAALIAAAESRTLGGLLAESEFIALVRLSPWKGRERSRNVRTGRLTIRLPVDVEHVLRGAAVPDSCGLVLRMREDKGSQRLDPIGSRRRSNEARRLAVSIPTFPTSRALVTGRVDSTDIFIADCLAIDTDGRLRLREPSVEGGALQLFRSFDMSVVETLIGPAAAEDQ